MVSENMKFVLMLINIFLLTSWHLYNFASMALSIRKTMGLPRWPAANLLWYWSKWPALVSIYFEPIFSLLVDGDLGFWEVLFVPLFHLLWWFYKNYGDDDDHKELKKKLKEKVHVVGGKLVVVPEPA